MTVRRVVVPLWPGSDGDATHRPKNAAYIPADDSLYLEKLASRWMEARGEAVSGKAYVLQSLPAGYELYQRPRQNGLHIDKHLFGHPGHKLFDSPNRFYTHFEYLMNNAGNSIGCPCTVCNAAGGRTLPMNDPAKKVKSASSSRRTSGTSTPYGGILSSERLESTCVV
jgi:hypothetical protein